MADVSYAQVVHELTADGAVVETQMMGMPSLKLGSKLFAGSREGGLVHRRRRRRRAAGAAVATVPGQ